MFIALLSFLGLAIAGAGQGHTTIAIEAKSGKHVHGRNFDYQFRIHDMSQHKYLGESDLAVTHEKILHFIVYDKGLKEFQHVHPTFDGQYWNVSLNFKVSGDYKVWAQGQTTKGQDFSAPSELIVMLNNKAWPVPAPLSDIRSGEDRGSLATISNNRLTAGSMVMLDLDFSRTDGSAPEITPYLGAVAHVIAVSQNAEDLAHVHPDAGSGEIEGMLHVTFPDAGLYRLWVQFMDAGTLRTVELSVEVF